MYAVILPKMIAVLESFKTVYEPLKVTKVLPFAVASLRLVKNKEQIVKRIRKETGLSVKVLRGSEETKLNFAPLTSIWGYAELIENDIAKPEDVKVFASKIHKEANRLLSIANDIITLSKLDEPGGRVNVLVVEVHKATIDLKSIVGSGTEIKVDFTDF